MAHSPYLPSPEFSRKGAPTDYLLPSPSDDRELSPMRARDGSVTQLARPALGRPSRKARFDALDVVAVGVAVATLVVSVCVVHPHLGLAWLLGFQWQIIIIGLLLSVMNMAMRRILPTLFLVIEAHWGRSRLQDYEAILRNSVTQSHTHPVWRAVLFLLLALPLVLSVAYKRFLGGVSSVPVLHAPPAFYGAASTAANGSSGEQNPLFYALNATSPFNLAVATQPAPPARDAYPIPYGYNALLISNEPGQVSAALLDTPMPDYIQSIQQNLTDGETWHVAATVNGTVTSINTTFAGLRDNAAFWNASFSRSWDAGLSSWVLDDGYDLAVHNRFGAMAGVSLSDTNAFMLAGDYVTQNTTYNDVWNYRLQDPEKAAFGNASGVQLFATVRQQCRAEWEIGSSSVRLLSGNCSGVNLNQDIYYAVQLNWLDAVPILIHSAGLFSPIGPYAETSPWRNASYAMNIAAVFWSRTIERNATFDPAKHQVYYPARDQTVFSTVPTLDANAALYLVLAIQPLLTVLGFVAALFFYHVPIAKGFGIVSILAGIDRESPAILAGAALSGKLSRPVYLDIGVHDGKGPLGGPPSGEIRYSLSSSGKRQSSRLQRIVYM